MQDAITFELPITKAIVTVRGYLTTGQSRELQRTLLAQGAIGKDGVNLESVSPDAALDMQDKAAVMLIKEIKNTDGSVDPFTPEWLSDLPIVDGNRVYEEVNRLIGEGSLSEESKKK